MEQKQQLKSLLLTPSAITSQMWLDYLKSSSFLLRDFTWSRPTQQNYLQPVKTNFLFKEVHESQIYKELRNLKRKKATGLDNFPSGLLKNAASVIAKLEF